MQVHSTHGTVQQTLISKHSKLVTSEAHRQIGHAIVRREAHYEHHSFNQRVNILAQNISGM